MSESWSGETCTNKLPPPHHPRPKMYRLPRDLPRAKCPQLGHHGVGLWVFSYLLPGSHWLCKWQGHNLKPDLSFASTHYQLLYH